ncbi:membrane hypothetical protein [Nitrosopumilaceae archaeon]|nr:membrane hypothetical protein [Nitrosopumilaceae archaeon]
MITLLRQHYQFDLVTSKEYQTTVISTIKIEGEGDSIFFMPASDILENLEIRNSQGRHMTVISRAELEEKFGIDYDRVRREMVGEGMDVPEDLGIIPIVCTPTRSGYEKIFATYTSPIKVDRYESKRFSRDIEIAFRFKVVTYEMIRAGGMMSDRPFELHVLVKVGEDYRIIGDPAIHVYPDQDDKKIRGARESRENTYKYYVESMRFGNVVIGKVRIALARSLSTTAKIISGVTAILPVMLISLQIMFSKVFVPTLEILGGSIALLIGERVWVLKDRYIMRRWVRLQHWLIGVNGAAFLIWFVLYLSGAIESGIIDWISGALQGI